MKNRILTRHAQRALALVLVAISTHAPAAAQTGGYGGSGGSVGGGGGVMHAPGGPPTVNRTENSAEWGGRSSVLNLMADAGVQREIGLTPQQQEEANSVVAAFRQTLAEQQDTIRQRFRTRSPQIQEAQARIASMRQTVAEFDRQIEAVLTPDQQVLLSKACEQDRKANTPPGSASGSSSKGAPGSTAPSRSARADAVGSVSPLPPGTGTSQVASGQDSFSSSGDPGSPMRVIRNLSVRSSLGLTQAQSAEIDRIMGRFQQQELQWVQEGVTRYTQGPARHPRRNNGPDLPTAASQATLRLEQLLQPAQRARLQQISLQTEGASALFRPALIQALKLTSTQQARLASIAQATRKKADAILGHQPQSPLLDASGVPVPPNRPARKVVPADIDRAEQTKEQGSRSMLAVLTPDQRQTYNAMLGRPYPGLAQIPSFGGGGSMSQEHGQAQYRPSL
jgi:hypothetical protein